VRYAKPDAYTNIYSLGYSYSYRSRYSDADAHLRTGGHTWSVEHG
jgi:hypothetical protein